MKKRSYLDQFTLDIEFLLISVIQGLALGVLATNAATIIGDLQFLYWPYVFSGLFFILIFWSLAIIHAVSFITWPLDLAHNFLYFFASFIEVMAFSHMTDPRKWFAFITCFFLVAAVLYIVDLRLIKQRKSSFKTLDQKLLYKHICTTQTTELYYFVPLALIFNVCAFYLTYAYPNLFLEQNYHLSLIFTQIIFGIIFMVNSLYRFHTRSKLLSNLLTTSYSLTKRKK